MRLYEVTQLCELFDSEFEIEELNRPLAVSFYVESLDKYIHVALNEESDNVLEAIFLMVNSDGVGATISATGNNKEMFHIFSGVIQSLKYLAAKNNLADKAIIFSSSKGGSSGNSRSKLYLRFIKSMAEALNKSYTYIEDENNAYDIFLCLNESLKVEFLNFVNALVANNITTIKSKDIFSKEGISDELKNLFKGIMANYDFKYKGVEFTE